MNLNIVRQGHIKPKEASIMEYQVILRIVLLNSPHGVLYCLQDDNGRFVSATMSTGNDIVFEFQTVVKPNQQTKNPNFTCPFARGTPSKRFFYINIGQLAGQKDTPWQRRAKVWINGWPKSVKPRPEEITWQMVNEVAINPNTVLMTKYQGMADDGSPSLHGAGGWQIALR